MTTPDLRTAAAKAARTLRATADGFERRDDHEHPLSQLLVNSLRHDADDIDAALAGPPTACPCTADGELAAGSVCRRCGHRDHGRSGCGATDRSVT